MCVVESSLRYVVLSGALAVFTFDDHQAPTCHILQPTALTPGGQMYGSPTMILEKGVYHGMTAAPSSLGYPGTAVVLELSGHTYNPAQPPVIGRATWIPTTDEGRNGDANYYLQNLLPLCPHFSDIAVPPVMPTRPARRTGTTSDTGRK
jgi:hypothetical protein